MMINSIFDPNGTDTEHSGSRFTPARADNNSQMPADITDGALSADEVAEMAKLRPDPDAAPMDRDSAKELNPDYSADTIWSDRRND